MDVHFSYKISKTADLEKQVKQQLEKLSKYLRVFRPDLVHVKGIVEESSAREGFVVSLNLRLPSGQMAAQEKGPVAATAVKATFDALTEQLKHHKQVLPARCPPAIPKLRAHRQLRVPLALSIPTPT